MVITEYNNIKIIMIKLFMMKNNLIYAICFLQVMFMLVSCNNEVIYTNEEGGYIEYQYDYKVEIDGVKITKQAYKRMNLSNGYFALYEVNDLPDSIISKVLPDSIVDGIPDSIQKYSAFRKVELFLCSKEFNPNDSLHLQQPGSTVIQITLVDSLFHAPFSDRLFSSNYTTNTSATSSMQSIYYNKKPMCLGMNVNMNMRLDTISNSMKYEYTFKGQNGKSLRIYDLGNSVYQIISNGIFNNKVYTLNYIGLIKQSEKIK